MLYENHADIGRAVANSKIPREEAREARRDRYAHSNPILRRPEVFIVSKIPPTQMGLVLGLGSLRHSLAVAQE